MLRVVWSSFVTPSRRYTAASQDIACVSFSLASFSFFFLAPLAILPNGRECLLLLRLGVMAFFVDTNGDPSSRIAADAGIV